MCAMLAGWNEHNAEDRSTKNWQLTTVICEVDAEENYEVWDYSRRLSATNRFLLVLDPIYDGFN